MAARAAEMEETYEVTIVGYNRILEEVEVRIKNWEVSKDKVDATQTDRVDEPEVSLVNADMLGDVSVMKLESNELK